MPSRNLIEAIAVTAELCGRTFSQAAAAVFVDDLAGYPEPQVISALRRCRREVRGVLTVQDVISRIDDGRLGPEEAWALVLAGKDEAETVVWTDEITRAWATARAVYEQDEVGGRMAFRETYCRLVSEARAACLPCEWRVLEGHDAAHRSAAVKRAIALGRVPVGADHLLALESQHAVAKLLIGSDSADSSVGLSATGQAAIQRMRIALSAHSDTPTDPETHGRQRAEVLRAEALAKVAAYADAHGIDLSPPAPPTHSVPP